MELFLEISIILSVATLVAIVMRILKQPLIIGHILTGLLVGPFIFNVVHSPETLVLMGEFGVAILLFTVGLHLSPDVFRQFGRVALITGLGQVSLTSFAGYLVGISLGFDTITALYMGIALAFSSTIIIMKLITDKGDLEVLYAKIAIGFLLVQDVIAVLILMGIPLFDTADMSTLTVLRFIATGLSLIAFIYLASRFFISRVARFIEQSQEFLFLFAITWGVGIAALFREIGFSLESGALIAGIALATIPSRHEISARLTPLRDFFITIFFIYLGSQLQLGSIVAMLPIALTLSALVLIGNPLILMVILGALGYKRKTNLQTGFTVAQISEFSIILIALGVSLGHLDKSMLSLVTLVGLITIFGSTYLVMHSDRIYKTLAPYLTAFERANVHEPRLKREHFDVVLIGCNRIGYDFVESLIESEYHLLVVDYNPDTIRKLEEGGVAAAFGDASDISFLETIDFSDTRLVISTVPDSETNTLIHRVVSAQNSEAITMVVAHCINDALTHYENGIDYVILPHFLGGKHAAELVMKFKHNREKYENLRDKHREHLQLRVAIGHDEPL